MTQPAPGNYPAQGPVPARQPNNHLVFAILVTIFCGFPAFIFGIVAIVKAAQVNGLWTQGRYAEAQQSADSAKKWAWWGVIIGLIVIAIYVIVAVATNGFNMETTT